MKCDVDACRRAAKVIVHFVHGGSHPYCDWHAYRNDNLRWKADQVNHVERVR